MLPAIGISGQQRLGHAKVMVVGLGGLGSPVAMYLAAAGLGSLTLLDFDRVDLSNLQRQIAHRFDQLGEYKTDSARLTVEALNPHCQVTTVKQRLEAAALQALANQHDLVVDCSDNFATRFMLNRICVTLHKPLVSGAAIRWEGQICCFDNQADSPCYHCLYPDTGEEDQSCTENGVVAPLVGIIGSMQALEAVKLICNCGEPLQGRLLALDGLHMQWRSLKINKDPDCPVCGEQHHD